MRSFTWFLVFFPIVLLGAHITWEPVHKRSGEYNIHYKSFPFPDSGLTYIFWHTGIHDKIYGMLYFQIRYKNGTFTSPRNLTNTHKLLSKGFSYSVQVSHNGNRILLAYNEYKNAPRDFYVNIYFIESTNGGKDWTQPIPVLEEEFDVNTYPSNPAMLFEEDIDRVTISYDFKKSEKNILRFSVREPGSTKFVPRSTSIDTPNIVGAYLAATIDKVKAKRYLHVLWLHFDDLYYTKSENNGTTWTPSKLLGRNEGYAFSTKVGILVNDYNAFESGLFVQHYFRQDIKILYSQNHGDLWVTTKVGIDKEGYHGLCVCGYNGVGRLISMNGKVKSGNGYVRYQQPYQKYFTNAEYPFDSIPVSGVDIHCKYDGRGKYMISAIVYEDHLSYEQKTYMAFGTMNGTN